MIKRNILKINGVFKQEYYKNILIIASGVFLTQFLLIVISPILTRFYSAESFGTIAFYLSIVNIITVVSTGRYDSAIVLADSNKKAINLFLFLALLIAGFSFLSLIGILIIGANNLVENYNFQSITWVYGLPILLFFNASFFISRTYLTRKKLYKKTTTAGILKSVVLNSILLVGCAFSGHPIFFLVANITSQILETVYLFVVIRKNEPKLFSQFDKNTTKNALIEFKNFPKYSLFGDLVNVYTTQNATLLLTTFFSDAVVGLYSITQRVMGIPIKLISASTLEVYKQKAAEEFNTNGNCQRIFVSTFKTLVLISIAPTLVIALFSPTLFTFVFGQNWVGSGYYARYLSIMFFFQFTASPLGFTLLIANKQKTNLFWQIGLLLITTTGLYIGYINKSSDLSIFLYGIAYSVMYVIYLFLSFKASKGK